MTIGTLVEKIEESFEPAERKESKPQTLAKAVSDALLPVMPRISNELFELRRRIEIQLTPEQKKEIGEKYFGDWNNSFCLKLLGKRQRQEEESFWKHEKLPFKCRGTIPSFSYSLSSEEFVQYDNCASVFLKVRDFNITNKGRYSEEKLAIILGNPRHLDFRDDSIFDFGNKKQGLVKLKYSAVWESPFKLNAATKVPEVPETFRELGDEAIATYYDFVRKVPANLRNKTNFQPPQIGVLWAPTPKSFYATGKIPKVEPSRPKGCPALVLDIPDEEKSYRHVVAAWNIDEELPFRNWLIEYSESR